MSNPFRSEDIEDIYESGAPYSMQPPIGDFRASNPERGEPIAPLSQDEQLQDMMDAVHSGMTDGGIAELFNLKGDKLIEAFLERHAGSIPDQVERQMLEVLRAAEQWGTGFSEGNAQDASKLAHAIKKSLIPEIMRTFEAERRQKYAKGGRDEPTGRAAKQHRERMSYTKEDVARDIQAQVRNMPEFKELGELERESFGGRAGPAVELAAAITEQAIFARQRYLWNEASLQAQGAFAEMVARFDRKIEKNKMAQEFIHQEMYGHGAAAAQRQRDQQRRGPLPSRPWAKQTKRRASYAPTEADLRAPPPTDAPAMPTTPKPKPKPKPKASPKSPAMSQAILGLTEQHKQVLAENIARHQKKIELHAEQTATAKQEREKLLKQQAELFPKEEGTKLLQLLKDMNKQFGEDGADKMLVNKTNSAERSFGGWINQSDKYPKYKGLKSSDSKIKKLYNQVQLWYTRFVRPARVLRQKENEPSPSPISKLESALRAKHYRELEAAQKMEAESPPGGELEFELEEEEVGQKDAEEEEEPDVQIIGQKTTSSLGWSPPPSFLRDIPGVTSAEKTYMIIPMKAKPEDYQAALNVRARDIVDLFDVYHRHIDYANSIAFMWETLMQEQGENEEFRFLPFYKGKYKEELGNHSLKEVVYAVASGKKYRIDRRNFTVPSDFDMQAMTRPFQYKLLQKGSPGAKVALGKRNTIVDRINKVRPDSLMLNLIEALLKSAVNKDLGGLNAFQFIQYKEPKVSADRTYISGHKEAAHKEMGLDRQKLRLISSLFGGGSIQYFNPTKASAFRYAGEFWDQPVEEQLRWLTTQSGGKLGSGRASYKIDKWLEVLIHGFSHNEARLKAISKKGSYSADDAAWVWTMLSADMKPFWKNLRKEEEGPRESGDLGDRLAYFASRRTPSPSPFEVRPARDRKKTPLATLHEEGGAQKAGKKGKGGKSGKGGRRRVVMEEDAWVSEIGLKKMDPFQPITNERGQKHMGLQLYGNWQKIIKNNERIPGFGRLTKTEQALHMLYKSLLQAHKRRLGEGPTTFRHYNNINQNRQYKDWLKNKHHGWKNAFSVHLDKVGWNHYVEKLGLDEKVKQAHQFDDVMNEKAVWSEMFRGGEEEKKITSDQLLKWTAGRLFWYNQTLGIDPPAAQWGQENKEGVRLVKSSTYDNWRKDEEQLAKIYKQLVKHHDTSKGPFPIEDWEDRLSKGQQYWGLKEATEDIVDGSFGFLPPAVDFLKDQEGATGPDADLAYQKQYHPTPVRQKRRSIPPRVFVPKQEEQPRPEPRQPEPDEQRAAAVEGRPNAAIDHEAILQGLVEQNEREFRAYLARPGMPIIQHTHDLRAEVLQRGQYEVIHNVHLLQTDNDVQPVMGAVHMVNAAVGFGDKHFMHDIEGDINEGQRIMVERSRKGPFRDQGGRSTVMDSSAHVVYRKRSGIFEITVKRGVIRPELQQMLSKLSMHRMSTGGSMVTIIKGRKRFRLGKLSEINLQYLRELVEDCVNQYGNCGLEITESKSGSGTLYRDNVHKARFKSNARRRKGPAAQRRAARNIFS